MSGSSLPPEPWECPLDRCLAAADRFVLHGPFNELTPAAIDPMVLRVTETRYRQAIGKAQELQTPKLVLHAGFLPLVYDSEWFVERSVIFWRRLIREVPEGLTVCLENVLEPEAALLTQIVRGVDDLRLRICLDLGHANTFASKEPPEAWLRACAPFLSHVHLHNNEGGRVPPGTQGGDVRRGSGLQLGAQGVAFPGQSCKRGLRRAAAPACAARAGGDLYARTHAGPPEPSLARRTGTIGVIV